MHRFLLSLLLVALTLAVSAQAQTPTSAKADKVPAAESKSDPRKAIADKFETKVDDVRPSQIPGLYEVAIGADTAYVSADGRYLIAGDLFEVDSRKNLTEARRSAARIKNLSKLDERDMIVFAPSTPAKHTITVFTDVECGYCRKLHGQIDEINKLGIRVRYMAYPRAGPGTDDWHKMEAVWCSKDRKSAITQAKLGQAVKAPNCGATPIAKQFELGERFGVRGTPAIFTNDGDYIGGYLPPAQLLQELDRLKAQAAAE
jgi:thiol:disulfide interchange protein DsbC